MLFDVIDAKYVGEFKIKVFFEDGKNGVVDFQPYIQKGGVFNNLKDKNYFQTFAVNKDIGTICWPNGADVAPESLYSKMS